MCWHRFERSVTLPRAAWVAAVLLSSVLGSVYFGGGGVESRLTPRSCPEVPDDVADASVRRLAIPPLPTVTTLSAWLKPEQARFGPAPEEIPAVLLSDFTLNATVPMVRFYFNQAYLGTKALVSVWTVEMIDGMRAKARRRERFNYDTEPLYQMLERRTGVVTGLRGLVIGSESPWLEAILLEHGAAHVATLEFGEIRCSHPQIDAYTPHNFTTGVLTGAIPPFDFAITYSSLEHDGLGRYGDVLNPWGDLHTMARLRHIVKPGGLVMVGVPCCQDRLDWNAHRVYGPRRLPLMFAGYRVAGVYPSEVRVGDASVAIDYLFQPLWVLQNRRGCDGAHEPAWRA